MQSFEPPFWLRNPHLLTVISSLWPRGREILKNPGEAVLVEVDEGSQILVNCHLQPAYAERPTLILVHGLEGSANSYYVTSLTQHALLKGSNVVRVNLRSCGENMHLTPTLYHAGQSSDLLRLINFLGVEKGLQNFFLVGFSLGGNMVLKAASELGKGTAVRGVCAVAPSIDLELCVTSLEKGLNQWYTKRFLKSLKRKIIQKHAIFPDRFDVSHLLHITSIREFDEVYTSKDAGFMDAAHYYREASALPRLKHIAIPTHIIAAQDDPFIPFAQFHQIETNDVNFLPSKYGGHVGFIPTIHLFDQQKKLFFSWIDEQILNFCLKHLFYF